MTASSPVLDDWATSRVGKTTRFAMAAGGLITATLVMMLGAVLNQGAWLFSLAGVALAATAVRAARYPSLSRMASLFLTLSFIPMIARTL